MELTIKKLPTKKRNVTEQEGDIIKRAMISFQIVMGQYEKYTDEMKKRDLEKLEREHNASGLDKMNPFNVGGTTEKSYEPTLEDTKTFVYSSWAEAVANVQTPYVCSGQKKKGIRKQAFRDVQKGKYINNKVRNLMDEFITKLSGQEIQTNEKEENK